MEEMIRYSLGLDIQMDVKPPRKRGGCMHGLADVLQINVTIDLCFNSKQTSSWKIGMIFY